tara:strand:+ start:574 stop:1491 length:918 start_codon:yes stop_codon:yes gene_type:complete
MRKLLLLFFVCFVVLTASSQQDPQFSQNMFNKLANNPGYAGSHGAINAQILHRSQWIGFGEDGGAAISTQNFSVDAAIPILNGGVGLNIVKDDNGPFSNLGLQASYAYRTDLGIGQVGIGTSIGIYQTGLDGSGFKFSDDGDQRIPLGSVSGSALDLGAGVYYNTRDVYIGLSTAHINQPTIEYDKGSVALVRHYFLLTGYYYQLNEALSLNPSMYLKAGGGVSQLDINTNLIYNNQLWSGVTYRLDEGLVFLGGMNITKDLRAGVAYDIVLSELKDNSFEFMLGYQFNIDYEKPVSKYKNPRFL